MDAGVLGGILGMSVMACIVLTGVLYENGGKFMQKCKRSFSSSQQHQPLLQVTNPLLVRYNSKQFKIKELVTPK